MASKKSKNTVLPYEELIEKAPEEISEYHNQYREELQKKYTGSEYAGIVCRMLDKYYLEEPAEESENKEFQRRQTWMINHAAIMLQIHDTITNSGRMPSVGEIAQKASLSRMTVTKHLKHFDKESFIRFHQQKWKIATERVMSKLLQYVYSKYVDVPESIKAANTYLKFADKFLHPIQENHNSLQQNNFIQVNNIFISQETIKALPEEKREAIEALILESNIVKENK